MYNLWGSQASCDFAFGHKSFYRFSVRSCLGTSHKQIIRTPNARHRAFWVSRKHGERLFIHPLFIVRWRIAKYFWGKKQRAGNTTVPNWTSGSLCCGRFNTERTVTWTSARAAKKKTTPLIERPILSPRVNKHGNNAKWFGKTRLSYFSSDVSLNPW